MRGFYQVLGEGGGHPVNDHFCPTLVSTMLDKFTSDQA